MRGNYLVFMLMRQMRKQNQHKRKRRSRYHPETRTLPVPERQLLIGQPLDKRMPLWSPRYVGKAPVVRMGKPEVIVIRGEPEETQTVIPQPQPKQVSGFYFAADGVLYGPYQMWEQIEPVLQRVVKSGAKNISDIEWRQ